MKKIVVFSIGITTFLYSCQENSINKVQQISKEAIGIHDEIMPQIRNFDQQTLKIDSLLQNLDSLKAIHSTIDSNALKVELIQLKNDIEAATDNMMTWMKDYEPSDTSLVVQEKMLNRVQEMKKQFETVNTKINSSLKPLQTK
ncbi:transposase [Sphingobacterium sp. HJSM2_6]|uniref:transposase n=1 Tax=Sphingobacterium sp. HJSM2_6 TaxID=3366264 RepID=UPI003BBD8B28